MEDIQNQGVDPIEKQQEEEALKDVSDDEIRSKVIEELDLDETLQPELIDKLVQDKKEGNKKLGTAIRQKIGWRSKAQTPKEIKKEETTPPVSPPDVDALVDARLSEKLEERDLASLDFSDELKGEVKAFAKAKGISVREASKSEYISFIREKEEAKDRETEASASTKGTGKTAKRDFSKLSDEEVTALSEEEWPKYKEWLKSQG